MEGELKKRDGLEPRLEKSQVFPLERNLSEQVAEPALLLPAMAMLASVEPN